MNLQISPAKVADSAGIAHVQLASYRAAYAPFFPPSYFENMTEAEQTQDWRELLYPAEHDPVLVAKTNGGEIIGYALGKVDSVDFERWQGELAALHVLRHHQRQGVGSRLFAAMAQELARHEKTGLALWTLEGNPVRTFYERLGGKLAKEKFYDVDSITITEVAYLWDNVFELIERLELRNGAN